jgi:hypothetical protein
MGFKDNICRVLSHLQNKRKKRKSNCIHYIDRSMKRLLGLITTTIIGYRLVLNQFTVVLRINISFQNKETYAYC